MPSFTSSGAANASSVLQSSSSGPFFIQSTDIATPSDTAADSIFSLWSMVSRSMALSVMITLIFIPTSTHLSRCLSQMTQNACLRCIYNAYMH